MRKLRKLPLAVFAAALATAGFLGCYMDTGNGFDSNGSPTGNGTDPGTAPLDDAGKPIATGVPCDVETILGTYCWSCHGVTPSAPSRLVTYTDLTVASTSNSANSEAEQALLRMKDTTSPMPPSGPKPTAGELAVFEAWVTGGAQQGPKCGGADAGPIIADDAAAPPNPYNTPLQCSSNKTWSGGDGTSMRPGDTCINCHTTQKKCTKTSCKFAIAGTVYPTAHEPNNCNGVAGSTVVITDANNKTMSLPVNAVGTFTTTTALVAPFTVKVINGSKTRVMTAKAPNGDCNSCHTATGTQSAPGRIMAP